MKTVAFIGLFVVLMVFRAAFWQKDDAVTGPIQDSVAHTPVTAPLESQLPSDRGLERSPKINSNAPTFHGFHCTVDCSGHEAGYEWAERHDIDDEADCGGNSQSFIEGCIAYARELSGEESEEEESDEDSEDGSERHERR
jgi:hypothetical protein